VTVTVMQRPSSTLLLFLAGALVALAGCRPLPKPAELVTLEELRKSPENVQAAKESDAAHQRALDAWRDRDLRGARHWARAGGLRLRIASAAAEEEDLLAKVDRLRGELHKVQVEHVGVRAKLEQIEEMVQLYEELAVAQSSALEKKLHLTDVQKTGRAERQIGQATLALKMAEVVGAEKYADKLYAIARTLVERATKELEADKPIKAFATAEMAGQKAQEAYEASKPHYLKEREAAARHAQNQALQKELTQLASSTPGISVKLVAEGGSQLLVIPVTSLFKPLASVPRADKNKTLVQIGERLKRYPEFHLVIRGYTSHRAPPARRRSLSRARARKVADQLIAAGLGPKRFMVRGEGGTKLIGHRRSATNDRVEICILLR
jgi:outer membrane protein OmpA-like peptidoglycan-associated protein